MQPQVFRQDAGIFTEFLKNGEWVNS